MFLRSSSGVRMLVVPGSVTVRLQAEREGLDEIFHAAGAEWRTSGLVAGHDRTSPNASRRGAIAVRLSTVDFLSGGQCGPHSASAETSVAGAQNGSGSASPRTHETRACQIRRGIRAASVRDTEHAGRIAWKSSPTHKESHRCQELHRPLARAYFPRASQTAPNTASAYSSTSHQPRTQRAVARPPGGRAGSLLTATRCSSACRLSPSMATASAAYFTSFCVPREPEGEVLRPPDLGKLPRSSATAPAPTRTKTSALPPVCLIGGYAAVYHLRLDRCAFL